MNPTQILEDLDKHAAEFNFPVLDNAYVEYGAARLSVFRSGTKWAVLFEVLGFSSREVSFVDDLYAYGSCVEREGFIGSETPLTSVEEHPLFNALTNECIADWSQWSIRRHDEDMFFSPSLGGYAQAGITIDRDQGPGSLKEIELLRYLIYRVGEEHLFLSDQAILNHLPHCRGMPMFVRTTRWQHPDVTGGEIPSSAPSIRSLVAALFDNNPARFDPGLPNTTWKSWTAPS